MKTLFLALLLSTAAQAGEYDFPNPPPSDSSGPALYAPNGTYLGNVNQNRFDPNSISNPYGEYGNPYSERSINNRFGQYGNPYSPDSVNYRYPR